MKGTTCSGFRLGFLATDFLRDSQADEMVERNSVSSGQKTVARSLSDAARRKGKLIRLDLVRPAYCPGRTMREVYALVGTSSA